MSANLRLSFAYSAVMLRSFVFLLVLAFAHLAAADERSQQWLEDIQSLRTQLEQLHPRFTTCGVSADVRQKLDALSGRVEALSDAQITVQLQSILAAVGDGHTLLWPFGMTRGSLLRLPLQLWEFDDGVYIVRSPREELVGRRVVRIGDVDTREVMQRLATFVSHDNEMQLRWATPLYATFTDFLVAAGATPDRDRAVITLDDGKAVELMAVAINPRELETKPPLPHGDETFRYAQLRGGILYIQLNAIDDAAPDRTLAQFGRQLRPLLAKTRRAILDLRLNNGGEARKANEVLKSLIAFDANGGSLVVLTSRITFSAAQTLATRLDEWTDAKFIGEATGSRPNHYGNERPFKLPHSQIRGTIASGINQPITAHDDRTTIAPDVAVPWNASDYFSGRDPALEAAIKLLTPSRTSGPPRSRSSPSSR